MMLMVLLVFFAFVFVYCMPTLNNNGSLLSFNSSGISSSVQHLLLRQVKELNEKLIVPLEERLAALEDR